MKIKTSDLTGPALDWAVAVAKGLEPRFFTEDEAYRAYVMESTLKHGDYVSVLRPNNLLIPLAKFAGYNDGVCWEDTFSPSADWSQGGPILDRERIELLDDEPGWLARIDLWARRGNFGDRYVAVGGPTILTATMRCFVSSKLGDEVDVPEELL